MYYLQSRYYNPKLCQFISSDDYIHTYESFWGKNLFSYCDNDAINRIDPLGHWWRIALLLVVVAIVVCGCAKKEQEIKKSIKYTVPLYSQGNLSLCWAYCQVMIESYQKGKTLSQSAADKRAKELAIKQNGKDNWNQGAWPTNLGSRKSIDSIEDLYDFLYNKGPVYGYYASSTGAHLIVVTGVDVKKNKVYTNNPWGVKGEQTFKDFQNGVARKSNQSNQGLVFKHIYLVKKQK